jgi:CRISPR/Cas system CSM-associated protein Csm3 (group 7 of RAMP superfamily)
MIDKVFAVWVHGELVQKGAWSIGGGAGEGSDLEVDAAFSRDGQGRLTLSGSALAGSFCDTASKIVSGGPLVHVTGKHGGPVGGKDGSYFYQSAWRFFHSHPRLGEEASKLERGKRRGVGIIHKTGAASGKEGEGALFDAQVSPTGTRWPFTMRIDVRAGGAQVEWLAREVLRDWVAGMGWLGAGASRGMGWLELDSNTVWVVRLPLTVEGLDADTSMDVAVAKVHATEAPSGLELWSKASAARSQRWTDWAAMNSTAPTTNRWWRAVLDVTVCPGARDDGWGLDALSVGGHEEYNRKINDEPSPVARFACSGGHVYVPGSSLRGPLRHGGAALLRGAGHHIIDPVDDREAVAKHEFDKLFGVLKSGSRLLIRDGLAVGDLKPVELERHAEDEFAASTYKNAKYTVEAVLQGAFASRIVVEAQSDAELRSALEQVRGPLQLAELGHLPMGGDAFAGNGWPTWRFHGLRVGRFGCGDQVPRSGTPQSVGEMLAALEPALAAAAGLDTVGDQADVTDSDRRPGPNLSSDESASSRTVRLTHKAHQPTTPDGPLAVLVSTLADQHPGPWLLTLEPEQGPDRRDGFAQWFQPDDVLPGGEYAEAHFHFPDGLLRIAATAQGIRSWGVSTRVASDHFGVGLASAMLGLAMPRMPPGATTTHSSALVRGDFGRFGLERVLGAKRVKVLELFAEDGGRLAWHFDPRQISSYEEG